MSLFRKKKSFSGLISPVDLHSHLLPGIDDGVQTIEESLEVIKAFKDLGYTRLITTPHIMFDHYRNDPEIIKSKLGEVRAALKSESIDIEIEAAAEYYLDEFFLDLLNTEKEILTFGKNYLLFELSFMTKPLILKESVFMMQTKGYVPVLAHPERYIYFQNNINELKELHQNGVLLQLNTLSLSGYYSKQAKKLAETLLKEEMISFIGSDCHNLYHFNSLSNVLNSSAMNSLVSQNILNNSL